MPVLIQDTQETPCYACSNWRDAGNHMLRLLWFKGCWKPPVMPLLMRVLAKPDWIVIPPESRMQTVSLHGCLTWTLRHVKALIRTASGKAGGRSAETESTADSMAWRATEAETGFLCNSSLWRVVMPDDTLWEGGGGAFQFESTWQSHGLRHCHNYPGVNQARELRCPQCRSNN